MAKGKIIVKKSTNLGNFLSNQKNIKQKTIDYDDNDEIDIDGGSIGSYGDDIIEEEDFSSNADPGDGDVTDTDELDNPDDEDNEDNEEGEDEIMDEEEIDEDNDKFEDQDYDDEDYEEPGDEEGYNKSGSCLYKFNKNNDDDDDNETFEELHFEDDDVKNDDIITDPEKRESKPILTKYERVRILGDRTKQLSLGAKPMLLNVDNLTPRQIAQLELERKVIPFIIEKTLPDGRRERWKVSELEIVN